MTVFGVDTPAAGQYLRVTDADAAALVSDDRAEQVWLTVPLTESLGPLAPGEFWCLLQPNLPFLSDGMTAGRFQPAFLVACKAPN